LDVELEKEFSKEELESNNRARIARQTMYKTYGYDNEKERLFIISAAWPVTGRILEAGTGKGYLTLELAKKGYMFTTYDINPEVQRIAKMNLAQAGLIDGVNFVIEGKEKLGFEGGSFDVIFCVNTLHHLEKSSVVLDEFLRVLSEKGRLILSDFTEKAFQIMDIIHASEGGKHEVTGWSMDKAAGYIEEKGYNIEETADDYQRVFIIQRER
jgi:2-polyprenyl-3-methyl-5-hydroxy-6-metoxy-1,4-benzoquinol methylase